MVDYKIFVNNGNEAFRTTGKTLSVEEQPRTISVDFLAEEMSHANELIPLRTYKEVLSIFGSVAARLMAEGFALQFQNDSDVLLRLYTDARIQGGNINLQRARELMGDNQLTEAQMVERASEIVAKAGVQLRAYAEVQSKFTELLKSFKPSAHLAGIDERAYVERKGEGAQPDPQPNTGGDDNTGDTAGGDNGSNGGGDDV